ncbi:MAG: BrnT family toxin [Magnetococcales bacterium]|nr:BrnT family toxin [Magnetococcales bacterium]
MNIEWDSIKAKINQLKHGIAFADVVGVLDDPMALVSDDDSLGEERFQVIDMDGLGRVLAVVFTYRGDAVRLISARRAEGWERKLYEG